MVGKILLLKIVDDLFDPSIGQATPSPTYTCEQNNFSIDFNLSSASHSAWSSSSNCSLSQCNNNNNNSCRLSMTPCFDYRTTHNVSYCAPASLCSILELCNNITGTCTSNTSVCVVNSCCEPKPVCLPLAWITFCPSTRQFFRIKHVYSSSTKKL
jgi:hypothetical protein